MIWLNNYLFDQYTFHKQVNLRRIFFVFDVPYSGECHEAPPEWVEEGPGAGWVVLLSKIYLQQVQTLSSAPQSKDARTVFFELKRNILNKIWYAFIGTLES
jgi:hypothetical protein